MTDLALATGNEPQPAIVRHLRRDECWARLRSVPVGRLVLHDERLEVFPVNFVVDGGSIVIRTAPGTKLNAITRAPEAAFEADQWSKSPGTVWSVVARGEVRQVRGFDLLQTLELPLFPWQKGRKGSFIRLDVDEVTGVEFTPTPALDETRCLGVTRPAATE